MKIAFLMDPLAHLKPYKDTSILLLQSAESLGWEAVYFTQADLFCEEGKPYAKVYKLKLRSLRSPDWVTTQSLGVHPLSDFDIVFMRKDPPFDIDYIYTTYALELAEDQGVFVVNRPQSLRDVNEKFFTLHFPQCCPKTLVSQDIEQLRVFWQAEQEVIFKPLAGMGGQSIFYAGPKERNVSVILEVLTNNQTRPIMAQRYIPDITSKGDKRILLLHGKPIAYALARIPAKGELRGNLAAGATGQVVSLTKRDHWLCEQIGPVLLKKGLYFVGLDVIGDYVTEINVTSPTCLREISTAKQLNIAGDFLRELEKTVKNKQST
jgi:glutathione synthase